MNYLIHAETAQRSRRGCRLPTLACADRACDNRGMRVVSRSALAAVLGCLISNAAWRNLRCSASGMRHAVEAEATEPDKLSCSRAWSLAWYLQRSYQLAALPAHEHRCVVHLAAIAPVNPKRPE